MPRALVLGHFPGFFAERGFDSYALSLRGHGESGGGRWLRWTSVAAYVADVERVAADLPRQPVVSGHSLGGFVVQKYLERHDPPAAVLVAPAPARGMGRPAMQKYLERHDPPAAVLVAPAPARGMGRPAMRMFLESPWLSLKLLLTLEPGALFSTPE